MTWWHNHPLARAELFISILYSQLPPSRCVYIINLASLRLYNKTSRLIMLSSMHSDFIFKCKSCEYQEKVTPTSSLSTLLVQMSNIDIPYCRVTCPGCRANLFLCLLCDKYNYNCLASRIFLIKQHITTCQLRINQSSLQLIAIRYIEGIQSLSIAVNRHMDTSSVHSMWLPSLGHWHWPCPPN
jgi:hypothetical protein